MLKDCQRQSYPNTEAFLIKLLYFLPNVLMCVQTKYEKMLTKSGELLSFTGPKLSQQIGLDFLCNTKVSCDKHVLFIAFCILNSIYSRNYHIYSHDYFQ